MSLNSLQRVAGYILSEYNKHGVTIKLERREVIASILSISVRHLNRTLATLHRENTIELKNKTLIVKDIHALMSI